MERVAKQVRQLDRQDGREEMSFYLTLPSDSNRQEYPNNVSNSFKVRLPVPVRLEGEWEVGMAAVSLPNAAPQMKKLVNFNTNYFLKVGWTSVDSKGASKGRQILSGRHFQ